MREPAIVSKCVCLALTGLLMLPAAYPPAAEATVSGRNAPAPTATGGRSDQAAQEHRYRLNPSPRQGYEILLEVVDAPGDFAKVRWSAHYQVTGCSYVTSAWAGTRAEPTKRLDVAFKPVKAGQWVATVYLDALLDEDYYGNGVCKWRMLSAAVGLSATSAKDDTTFVAELWSEQILAGQPLQRYYLKTSYPRGDLPGAASHGVDEARKIPEQFRAQVFSVVMRSRELP